MLTEEDLSWVNLVLMINTGDYKNGFFRITGFDLSNHFEDNILIIEKWRPGKVYSAIYWDAEQKFYYVKRFTIEESEKPQCFINENAESKL